MTLNCFKCQAEVVFDSDHIGKNGKKIPLDPLTKTPHDCPMRENPWSGRDLVHTEDKTNPLIKEEKDDHGNESYSPKAPDVGEPVAEGGLKYVDHTVARPSKVKIFHAENSDLVELAYNEFLQSKTFQWTRAQLGAKGNEFAIALYYEETK